MPELGLAEGEIFTFFGRFFGVRLLRLQVLVKAVGDRFYFAFGVSFRTNQTTAGFAPHLQIACCGKQVSHLCNLFYGIDFDVVRLI